MIEWNPPRHSPAADVLVSVTNYFVLRRAILITSCMSPRHHLHLLKPFQFQILGSTAGTEVRSAINASHEPPIPQLADLFNSGDLEPSPTSEFWRLCQIREDFRAQYHQYWKSTREVTRCRRAVDGVILPVAAHAAPPEGMFKYHGQFY